MKSQKKRGRISCISSFFHDEKKRLPTTEGGARYPPHPPTLTTTTPTTGARQGTPHPSHHEVGAPVQGLSKEWPGAYENA